MANPASRWFFRDAKWWEFWMPQSGCYGGGILVVIVVVIAYLVLEQING